MEVSIGSGNSSGNGLGNSSGNVLGDSLENGSGNSLGNSLENSLGNGLGNGSGNSLGNGLGNSLGNSSGNIQFCQLTLTLWQNTWLRMIYKHEPACVILTLFNFFSFHQVGFFGEGINIKYKCSICNLIISVCCLGGNVKHRNKMQ